MGKENLTAMKKLVLGKEITGPNPGRVELPPPSALLKLEYLKGE
jgi:hypothetical protein